MNQTTILVIEDDDLQYEIYEDALAGHKLVRATNASEALAQIPANPPDLVILDHVLSAGELGLEFLPEKMLRVLPHANHADETTLEGAVTALKRRLISSALQSEGGNKVAAAKRLGISRSYLHRLINDYEL